MSKNLWFHFEGNSGTQIHVVSSCGSCGNTVKVVKSEVSLKLRINFVRTKLTDNMTPLLSWKDKNNFFVIIHFAPFMVILWPACGLYLWHSCTALVWIWPHIVTEVVCLCRWVCFDLQVLKWLGGKKKLLEEASLQVQSKYSFYVHMLRVMLPITLSSFLKCQRSTLCAIVWCPILWIWQNCSGPLGGEQGGRVGGTDDDGDAHWKVRIFLLKETSGFK